MRKAKRPKNEFHNGITTLRCRPLSVMKRLIRLSQDLLPIYPTFLFTPLLQLSIRFNTSQLDIGNLKIRHKMALERQEGEDCASFVMTDTAE